MFMVRGRGAAACRGLGGGGGGVAAGGRRRRIAGLGAAAGPSLALHGLPSGGGGLCYDRWWSSSGLPQRRSLATVGTYARGDTRLQLYSWGEGYLGSLGQGDFTARSTPTRIEALASFKDSSSHGDDESIKDVSAGWAHTAVVTTAGRLFVFGRPHDMRKALRLRNLWRTLPFLVRMNQAISGVLDTRPGYQEVVLVPSEVALPEGEKAAQVSCSGALTAVVTESGRVLCMGVNHMGQCGIGSTSNNVWTPTTPVVGLPDGGGGGEVMVEVSCGFQHVVARSSRGRVYAWGKGERGQLGTGSSEGSPRASLVDLPYDEGGMVVSKVSSGFNHSAALTTDGRVYVWGKMQGLTRKKEGGTVAVPIYDDQLVPRQVVGLPPPATDLSCAHFHTAVMVGAPPSPPPPSPAAAAAAGGGQEQPPLSGGGGSLLWMFGMAASSRTQHHEPSPVPLPRPLTASAAGGGEEWRLLPSCMARTVLTSSSSSSAPGAVYSASFEGPETAAAEASSSIWFNENDELLPHDNQVSERGDDDDSKRRVRGVLAGMAHKLLLVDDEKERE